MWTLNFHPVFARHASIYPGDQAALASESLVGSVHSLVDVARIRFLFFPPPPLDFSSRCVRIAEKFRLAELSGQARVIPLFSPCGYAKEGRERGVMPCRFFEAFRNAKNRVWKRRGGEVRITSARLLECVGRLEGIASERVTVTLKRNAKLGGE